jgi:uncharacterized protein with FMN-binding domain
MTIMRFRSAKVPIRRALVAPGQSVVVRAVARKNGALYVNDGVYGALSDAGRHAGSLKGL